MLEYKTILCRASSARLYLLSNPVGVAADPGIDPRVLGLATPLAPTDHTHQAPGSIPTCHLHQWST